MTKQRREPPSRRVSLLIVDEAKALPDGWWDATPSRLYSDLMRNTTIARLPRVEPGQ